jgi:hypothetical protein
MIELEILQPEQVFDIPQVTGDEVIHSNYMIAFFYKAIA